MFDAATRPFQYALQARAGTDALANQVRAALELQPGTTLVSLDGRSAYDTISRASFLTALRAVAPELLPFVRLFYGQPSTYCWWDAEGCCRDIQQGEGCEQGDALAPALFSLGQHGGLEQASSQLQRGERLLAFLDDLYILTPTPARARPARDMVVAAVEAHCGIASNEGKTRVFAIGQIDAPPGITQLGEDVWRGDSQPPAQRGVVVLGTPIGHPAFVRAWSEERLRDEQALLEQLTQLPDLQCAWLLLAMCASPRANHVLRTVPPDDIAAYAVAHDAALWDTLMHCLGGAGPEDAEDARCVAFWAASACKAPLGAPLLPTGLGGPTRCL